MSRLTVTHSLTSRKIYRDLKFAVAWIELGVLSAEILDALEAECGLVETPNAEHYRWKVYGRHLQSATELDPEHAEGLYELAHDDPSPQLGAAMTGALLKHPGCPRALLERAKCSGIPHLAELASRQLTGPPSP